MIACITGGAGFLGQRIARQLSDRGDEVRVVDVAPRPPELDPAFDYVRADVLDRDALRRSLEGADVVVHTAFAPPYASAERLEEVNAEGPGMVAEVSVRCGVERLVLISSTIVDRPLRAHPLLRRSPLTRLVGYRYTCIRGEAALRSAAAGVQTAIVRPKTFLGPGRVGGFALAFEAIRTGGVVPIGGPGTNRYQYVHVDDLADGIVRLTDSSHVGVFEFGAPGVAPVRDEVAALIDHAGSSARALFLPSMVGRSAVRGIELAGFAPLSEFHHAAASGWDSVVDTTRAETELGWSPVHDNLDTLVDAYDWYAANATDAPTTHPVPATHRVLRRVLDVAARSGR